RTQRAQHGPTGTPPEVGTIPARAGTAILGGAQGVVGRRAPEASGGDETLLRDVALGEDHLPRRADQPHGTDAETARGRTKGARQCGRHWVAELQRRGAFGSAGPAALPGRARALAQGTARRLHAGGTRPARPVFQGFASAARPARSAADEPSALNATIAARGRARSVTPPAAILMIGNGVIPRLRAVSRVPKN